METADVWKFLNDSVFIRFSLKSESSLKFKEGEEGPPEYVTETDTVGEVWKYIITPKGSVMLLEEYLQETI